MWFLQNLIKPDLKIIHISLVERERERVVYEILCGNRKRMKFKSLIKFWSLFGQQHSKMAEHGAAKKVA